MSTKIDLALKSRISRRSFLKRSATIGLATLAGPALLSRGQVPTGPSLTSSELLTATNWGALRARVEGGRFIQAIPFAGDEHPTPMLQAMADRLYSSTRVKYPMVRAGFLKDGRMSDTKERGKGNFVRVSWDQAFELVANELQRVKDSYGNASIFSGTLDWHSVGKLHNAPVLLRRMLGLHGGFTDDAGDFSVQAALNILPHVVGTIEVYEQQTSWETILDNTKLVVLWGADLLKNNQIGWTTPDHYVYGALEQLKAKGIKTISIDPRITDTAEYLGSDWLAIRPNTDVALMLAIAHTLLTENLYDKDFIATYTIGFGKFQDYVLGTGDGQPKTPEWAASITEIGAGTIRDLARTMAAGRTMLMGGWSIQRQDHGEQAPWMMVTLAAMLGHIGLPGGGFGFSYHYASGGSLTADAPGLPGISAGDNAVTQAIPFDHALNDLLLNPGKEIDHNGGKITYPDIKLVYWAGGNPFTHQMDRNLQIQAWRRPETVIVNEPFWTSTAMFADIVLPVTTTFERNDLDILSEYTSHYIVAMHQIVEPLFEARSDYDIFAGIADKLGFKDQYTEGKSEMEWLKEFYGAVKEQNSSVPDFDQFWADGVLEFPIPDSAKGFVRHADFRADPLNNPLGTPSGKIEIYSNEIEGFGYDDCPPHPTWLEPAEWLGGDTSKHPLHMISPHPKYRLHSQLDNTWLRELHQVNGREPMWINPQDAQARGLGNGDVVRVFNDRGQLLAGVIVTDRIRPGVIAIYEGAWYDPDQPGEVGALCKHGNVNMVTLDKGTSKLAQGNVANTVLVQVEKFTAPLPEVTAFTTPKGA